MAVTFDTVGTGARVTNTTTASWSHTPTYTGSNYYVVAMIAVSGANTVGYNDASVTVSATYGGSAMTLQGGMNVNNATSNSGWLYLFAASTPQAGVSTVVFTVTKSGYTPTQITGNTAGYYGVGSAPSLFTAFGSSFSGETATGTQAPTGSLSAITFASQNSAIIITGPTGFANRWNGGAATTGLADYLSIADFPGNSAAGITVSGNNGGNWASVAYTMLPLGYTTYTASGAYTYTIPDWCNKIDVLLVGGGSGGWGGAAGNGSGGKSGVWATATLQRGKDIPWTTTTITGSVGVGGTAGGGGGGAGGPGGATTATATGMTSMSGAGGSGNVGTTNVVGASPGDQTLDGITYYGGLSQGSLNNAGKAPGGGGAAGGFASAGGAGAVGQAWFYAWVDPTLTNFFSTF